MVVLLDKINQKRTGSNARMGRLFTISCREQQVVMATHDTPFSFLLKRFFAFFVEWWP